MNDSPSPTPDVASVTPPAQTQALEQSPELPLVNDQVALTLNRAARRKLHKLKCKGHATHGAAARYCAVSAGREAIPQPTEAEREKVFSFFPVTASQVNFLFKCFQKERVQEVTDAQSQVTRITLKSSTRDEALLLGLHATVLKSAKRDEFVDQLLRSLRTLLSKNIPCAIFHLKSL